MTALPSAHKLKLIGGKKNQEWVKEAIDRGIPLLMCGETGTGKTYMILSLAASLGKLDKVIPFTAHPELTSAELLGKYLLIDGNTVWQDGILTHAVRTGQWLVLNEVNCIPADMLFPINGLFDDNKCIVIPEKDNEIVRPHEDFRFFCTCNPITYAGTKEMNQAFLSRFEIVLEFDQPTPAEELEIVRYHSGMDDLPARVIVDVMGKIREERKAGRTSFWASTRDSIQVAKHMQRGAAIGPALTVSVLNKMQLDERVSVETVLKDFHPSLVLRKTSTVSKINELTTAIVGDIAALEAKKATLIQSLDAVQSAVDNAKASV